MLPRTRLPSLLPRTSARLLTTTHSRPSSNKATTDNPHPVNDPNPKPNPPSYSESNVLPYTSAGSHDRALVEDPTEGERRRVMQAPNRWGTWSRRQKPRGEAMVGPRFEQTIMEDQPRPLAAIELIHKQPVRWTAESIVACDGGGGPLGHPRIFINVDKPQICWCTYCGVPFAHEHHRTVLEALPATTYPLEPTGDDAQVSESQSITDQPFEHR